jgi:hydroxyacylglutathione hydrolase
MTLPEIEADDAEVEANGDAVLLDVREPDEWVAGHAPGAQWVPLAEIPARLTELPRDRRILTICRTGARSGRAAEFLIAQGYDAVNVAGGMKAWASLGLTVETDDGSPGSVA